MPGYWTLRAAGHVPSGVNPKIAAEKELKEELGFPTPIDFFAKSFDSHEGRRFFAYIFTGKYSGQTLKPNKDEVEQVKFLNQKQIDKLVSSGEMFFNVALKNAQDFWNKAHRF